MPAKLCVVFLMALASSGAVPIRAGEDPRDERSRPPSSERTLRPGVAVERRLVATETHAYAAEVAAGKRWLVMLEQKGIDVVLAATANGTTMAVDTPTYRQGTESLLLAEAASGTVRIEVRPASESVAPGGYEIAIQELSETTAEDRRRLAAEAAMTEAGRLNHHKTAEARRQAAAKYLEALAEWRRLESRRQETRALFSIGTLSLRADEPRRAIDAYSVALPMLRALGERDAEAIALSNMGLAHWKLGDNDAARARLDEAMALHRVLGNRYGEAVSLNNLCLRSQSQGELTEALSCYERALQLLRELGELQLEALLLSNIGSVQNALGDPRPALESHQRALALRQSTGDRLGEVRSLKSIAMVYRRIGEMQEALDRYARALDILREVKNRRLEAVTLNSVGIVYYRLGEPRRALEYLEQALRLRRELADRRGEAITLTALGRVQTSVGAHAQAAELHRQALGLRQAIGDRRGQASSLNLLGQGRATSGDSVAAIHLFDQAIEILGDLNDRRELAHALHGKGLAHLATGELEPARASLDRALEIRRTVEDRHGEAETLHALGRAERQRGQSHEALRHLEAARGAVESLRTRVDEPDLRATFLASQRSAYELVIDLLMELHVAEPGQGFARRALETSERARARSLLDLRDRAAAEAPQGIDPASLASSEEIQELLDSDTWILEYALGEERSFLWLVAAESLAVFQLPARTVIETAAREVHRQLASLDVRAEPPATEAARALSRLLLGPIADRLSSQRLVVVADGALHYVPFAALPVPEGDGESMVMRHEIVHLPSASSLALQRAHLVRRPPAPRLAAVLADPVFEAGDPRLGEKLPRTHAAAGPEPGRPRGEPGTGAVPSDLRLDRLPSTRREARSIAEEAPPGETLVALDFDASRALVMGGALRQYRTVHFATHGLIDASRPELSGLVLSRVDPEGNRQDGFLRLRDVYNLELAADLVVLSGCRTAWGREIRGEGLVGLARGFMAAGVPRVVASLWRVEDRVTAELMRVFYRSMWQQGLSPAAALRQAQLSVARERRWRDAYYWGAFVLQGDWR